jgi:hypothetical protein
MGSFEVVLDADRFALRRTAARRSEVAFAEDDGLHGRMRAREAPLRIAPAT